MNNENTPSSANHERPITAKSGWVMLTLNLMMYVGVIALIITAIVARVPLFGVLAVGLLITGIVTSCGFFTLQPNTAAVLILFGSYKGTVRNSGFFWTNPFNKKMKVSLRSRNLNGDKLKVNDKRGNPIEIAAVVVWRVRDTAEAVFDVDEYEHYVSVQSESAVRHIASGYAYDDDGHEEGITLRASGEVVAEALKVELQERLGKAGVEVQEARLSHLAYAQEIAQAMLRRQQAEAVIAARTKIVQGAVGMVEMALAELESKGVVELDAERKASMVSNLLVVLCGESEVHPVVNTGTLYS